MSRFGDKTRPGVCSAFGFLHAASTMYVNDIVIWLRKEGKFTTPLAANLKRAELNITR